MKKILYSMAGEGRGHATRARTIIEGLRQNHKIIVYAPGHAYDLLSPIYKGTDVLIHDLPGLLFHYNSNKKLDYIKTGIKSLNYLVNLPALIKSLQTEILKEQPDLVITDFEPALARAAKREKVPFISFDHQHFLTTYDLSKLPLNLRIRASFMKPFVNSYYSGQQETIVSSFYFPPILKNKQNIKQIGVLLRDEIINTQPTEKGHLLVYLRRFANKKILETLSNIGCNVHVYGLGKHNSYKNLKFFDINLHQFVEDLASSRGLITTAGNQVIGESLYLGKPVLAMPEPGNFEQEINGFFIEQSQAGKSIDMHSLNTNIINSFLDNIDLYKSKINRQQLNGNIEAFKLLNKRLNVDTKQENLIIPYYNRERAVS